MYIFKNAFFNLGRNKGRNIIMAAILFMVLFAGAISIIVGSSTTQLIERQKAQFGAPVTLIQDYRKIPPTQQFTALPTADELMHYTDSEYLQKSQLNADIPVNIKELYSGGDRNAEDRKNAPVLMASLRKGAADEFSSGQRTLIEGHAVEEPNQCIISTELKQSAGLNAGDFITVQANSDEGKTFELKLKIVGVFKNNFNAQNLYGADPNQIVMDFKTLVASPVYTAVRGITQAQMVLKNPDDLEAFTKELQSKGLPEYYNVNVDDAAYKKVTLPLEGLKSITTTLTIVVTIFGAAVLLILSILSIRERKYEIGVLRAMGVKKGKVSLGLITETLFITICCLALALGSASLLSKPVGNLLLQTQTVSQTTENKTLTNEQGDQVLETNTGFADLAVDASELPALNAALDGPSSGYITLIALLLALSASAAGILFVIRFEPIKILSERN